MTKEDFKNLIEVQSLQNQIFNHLNIIEEEAKRITHIEKLRSNKEAELKDTEEQRAALHTEVSGLEKELFSLEKELERVNSHINDATDERQANALQKEIDTLGPKRDELEESILEKMETESELGQKIEEIQTFLKGSVETLNEINQEVDQVKSKENKEISNLEERIMGLLDSSDREIKESFLSLDKKFHFKHPVAFVVGNACNQCKMEVTSIQKNNIEAAKGLEYCGGCGRILAPTF